MEQKQQEQLVKSTAELVSAAVSASLNMVEERANKISVKFEEWTRQADEKMDNMINKVPTLAVRINELPIKNLSKRACKQLPRLLVNAKLKQNTLMVGPAGCGKTTAAHQVSEALGLQFGSVCLTAGASETWLFGRQTPTGFIEGMFSKVYREGGVFLADEMDAADANLLLSINTALSHSEMLNPMSGEVIKKHDDFVFIGAANTNGKGSNHVYTGRSRLDAATLDRFVVLEIDYDEDYEKEICTDKEVLEFLRTVRAKLRDEKYDEFVSTRQFISFQAQLAAGIPPLEIKNSMIMAWGDGAKVIANKEFENFFKNKKAKKKEYSETLREFASPSDIEQVAKLIQKDFLPKVDWEF